AARRRRVSARDGLARSPPAARRLNPRRSGSGSRMEEDEPDPVILPIEDSLDLHTFAARDVRSVVDEYLRQAVALGFDEVRLIHGKGKGVQRAAVQHLLSDHALVLRFFDAPPDRGGWGATVAILRRAETVENAHPA